MIVVREDRKRVGFDRLYHVTSWYLLGFILIYRRYDLLTVGGHLAKPSER